MKTARPIRAAMAAIFAMSGCLALAQSPAHAASGAYGTAVSCKFPNTATSVTLQPHFSISGAYRDLDGYAFYTSPADKIANVQMYWIDSGYARLSTVTSPNATSGVRTGLGKYYPEEPAGSTVVYFRVKDTAGRECWTNAVYI